MAKKDDAPLVKVILTSIYSGLNDRTPGPGDELEVDAEEAERLISIGAAKEPEAEKAPANG